ncbi:MAG: amidase, partial [Comamonadaceae bacterium]
MNEPVHTLSAVELHKAFREGALDPRDVVEDILARIEEWEPKINAFYRIEPEHARQ